jgi:signal peptide peptidase SppA
VNRSKFTGSGLLAINPVALGLEFLIMGAADRANRAIGDVAVVTVRGPLEHHAGGFFDNYDAIKDRARDALASSAKAVVLSIDSPGGLVSGVYTTSRELRAMAAAARKPLYAYADGECSSAAYALACAAEQIFVSVGATAGSIGVIAIAVDATAADKAIGLRFEAISSGRRKTDGNPHVAMSDESISSMQKTVDAQAAVLFALVSDSRGVSSDAVRGFQAGIFVGQQAIEVGLADDVPTTLEELAAKINAGTITEKALAGAAGETTTMDMEEVRKALGEGAAGDGEAAKKCRAALAALDGGDDPEKDKEKGASSEEPDKGKDKEKEPSDDKDKKKDDEKAKAAAASGDLALAAKVQSLTAWREEKEEGEERAKLMASRPDLDPDVVKFLNRSPVAIVKDAVKTFPRGKAKSPVAAALAAASVDVRATRGEDQGEPGDAVRGDYTTADLDAQMGLGAPTHAIRHDGTRLSLGVMTPDQARALTAERAKEAARAKEKVV